MDYIISLILGFIEGLTEFLPVSSTGHLILFGHLFGFEGEKSKTFEIFIQLGSILAITFLYRERLISLLNTETLKPQSKKFNIIHVFLGILPALVGGFLLHDVIKTYLFSPKTVVIGLIVGAFLLIFADKKKVTIIANSLDELSYKQALLVGLFQCLALYPGFSRSGSTISGGLLLGASKKVSAEFSFLIALPIMVAATGYDLLKSYHDLSSDDVGMFFVGFVTAFTVAMIAVKLFMKLLDKISFTYFAFYRIILALVFAWIVF